MESKKDLWLRLRNYDFVHLSPPRFLDRVQAAFGGPDASTRAFADKLTRKLRWSTPFALRAIDEYRKFIYLGLVADFPVTPPKVIDQVWHEHLLFSRAYREFCTAVLRREFDHNPELVPLDEQTAAFHEQFTETRELYRTEFNREPPPEFWGVAKFAGQPEPIRVRKPRRRREDGSDGSSSAVYVDEPLYMHFSGSSDTGGHSPTSMPEFGGGDSGGGGGGGTWSDSTSTHGGHGDAGGNSHGGTSDGGGGSSDGGSGDGGSGCSSGCGSS